MLTNESGVSDQKRINQFIPDYLKIRKKFSIVVSEKILTLFCHVIRSGELNRLPLKGTVLAKD